MVEIDDDIVVKESPVDKEFYVEEEDDPYDDYGDHMWLDSEEE